MTITPPNRPKLSRDELMRMVSILEGDKLFLVGVRGYYSDSMGRPGANDRAIYDDAIFLVGPDHFSAYNANTDPSITRKGVAVLKPGRYLYAKGPHGISTGKPYPALRQASNVTVYRDGVGERTDSPEGRFWINIHRGGYSTTSSLGCQTIHPDQWLGFLRHTYELMDRHGVRLIPYYLIETA